MSSNVPADGLTKIVSRICGHHGKDPAALIEILHDLQEEYGFIPEGAEAEIARELNLSRAGVHGVISFYHDFRRQPAGRVVIKFCRAEACQSMGALKLFAAACERYAGRSGETSAAGVTIEPVYCLGNCALSPAALVNGKLHGRLNAARLNALVREARS